jgi:hypothetical protein
MRMKSCHAPRIASVCLFLLSLCLGATASAEYLTTLNPAGEPGPGQSCIDTEDAGFLGTCYAHGAINRHRIYGYCIFEDGHYEYVRRCDLCPAGYERYRKNFQWKCRAQCPGGTEFFEHFGCVPAIEDEPEKDCTDSEEGPNCTAGNPIDFASGSKLLTEVDFEGSGPFPLRFERYYNSLRNRDQRIENLIELFGSASNQVLDPADNPKVISVFHTGAISSWPAEYKFLSNPNWVYAVAPQLRIKPARLLATIQGQAAHQTPPAQRGNHTFLQAAN